MASHQTVTTTSPGAQVTVVRQGYVNQNPGRPMCNVALLMFGVFFCFPGIILNATAFGSGMRIAGIVLLIIGVFMIIGGISSCYRMRNLQANTPPGQVTYQRTTATTTVPIVVHGDTSRMPTNIHPTTTVYQVPQMNYQPQSYPGASDFQVPPSYPAYTASPYASPPPPVVGNSTYNQPVHAPYPPQKNQTTAPPPYEACVEKS